MTTHKLKKILKDKTISFEEFSKRFTPKQKKKIAQYVREYELLKEVKLTRKRLGLTQAELAIKAHIPRTTITKMESGTYNPTIHTLMMLAEALGKQLEVKFV